MSSLKAIGLAAVGVFAADFLDSKVGISGKAAGLTGQAVVGKIVHYALLGAAAGLAVKKLG
jgi:hypothetical protein